MLRRPGTESKAITKGSSVVPGFAMQTSTPVLTAVATNASAPFMLTSATCYEVCLTRPDVADFLLRQVDDRTLIGTTPLLIC